IKVVSIARGIIGKTSKLASRAITDTLPNTQIIKGSVISWALVVSSAVFAKMLGGFFLKYLLVIAGASIKTPIKAVNDSHQPSEYQRLIGVIQAVRAADNNNITLGLNLLP